MTNPYLTTFINGSHLKREKSNQMFVEEKEKKQKQKTLKQLFNP